MTDKKARTPRAAMSAQERQWRSKLAQLVSQHGVIRGTLQERMRLCGKPNCRCTRGQRHRCLLLVISDKSRTRQLYIPKQWEPAVREWVKNYHDVRDLMEKISRNHWDKVQKRQG